MITMAPKMARAPKNHGESKPIDCPPGTSAVWVDRTLPAGPGYQTCWPDDPDCPTREDYLSYCEPCGGVLCGDVIVPNCPPIYCPPGTGPPPWGGAMAVSSHRRRG